MELALVLGFLIMIGVVSGAAIMEFLYWFREDRNRSLKTDIEWAINRFNIKYEFKPTEILIKPDEIKEFEKLNLSLKLVELKSIQSRYFGIR